MKENLHAFIAKVVKKWTKKCLKVNSFLWFVTVM